MTKELRRVDCEMRIRRCDSIETLQVWYRGISFKILIETREYNVIDG